MCIRRFLAAPIICSAISLLSAIPIEALAQNTSPDEAIFGIPPSDGLRVVIVVGIENGRACVVGENSGVRIEIGVYLIGVRLHFDAAASPLDKAAQVIALNNC